MITKYLKGLLIVLLFIPVLIKAQEKEKQEPPTQKEEYVKRIDKLSYGLSFFKKDSKTIKKKIL